MVTVLELQRRTRRRVFADGLLDIRSGLWIMLLSIGVWVTADLQALWLPALQPLIQAQSRGLASLVFVLALVLPLVLLTIGLRAVQAALGRRGWTNGVQPHGWLVPRYILFSAYGLIAAAGIIGVAAAQQVGDPMLIFRALFLGSGLAFAVMLLAVHRQLDVPHYPRIAVVGLCLSFAVVLLPVTVGQMALLIGAGWGGLLLASGLVALRRTAAESQVDTHAP